MEIALTEEVEELCSIFKKGRMIMGGKRKLFILTILITGSFVAYHSFKNSSGNMVFKNIDNLIASNFQINSSGNQGVNFKGDFKVYQNGQEQKAFLTYAEASNYAKTLPQAEVNYGANKFKVWQSGDIKDISILDVPLLQQLPELQRGCEVTSLSMLLQYAGINVDKLTLAQQIKKDPTPYTQQNGTIYYGNPNDGFVGDIQSFSNPGYGVYHGPIKDLAEKYLPNKILDLTGASFDDVLYQISTGKPVWVITNADFKKLNDNDFQTWQTPTGSIQITMKEHSVLVTGYDSKYVYINNPLSNQKNQMVLRSDFQDAWVQMGSQAITFVN